jgi:hypothetical protein
MDQLVTKTLMAALLAAALLKLSFAQEHPPAAPQDTLLQFMITVPPQGIGTVREVFSMNPGACLRGPLRFKDADGKVQFSLDPGIDYPTDCSTAQGMTCRPGTTFTVENIDGTTHVGCKP